MFVQWIQVGGALGSGERLLQSEMLLLHLAAQHLCCSDCSTPAQSFPWYYFPVFYSHASLLGIVLQCVGRVFLQLALFEISPLELTIQLLARCPAVIQLLRLRSPVELHCSNCNFSVVGLAVFQDFVLVNMSPLVMLTKINVKHKDQYSACFLIMAC